MTPKFDKRVSNLLEVLRANSEKYKFIYESPYQLDVANERLNDEPFNQSMVNTLTKTYPQSFVENTIIMGLNVAVHDLMFDNEDNYKELFFIHDEAVIANINFDILEDGGIVSNYIWQQKNLSLLMYWIFEYYLLENFAYIISDNKQTSKAYSFYARFLTNPNIKIEVLENSGNLIQVNTREELQQFYSKEELSKNYRFKLTKI